MKTNKKLFTTFAVFVLMLLMSVFCVTAFAEKADDDAQTPSAEKKVVSGCDLKKEDLQMEKVKMTGFSILVPKGDVITVESDSSVSEKAKLSYGFDRSTLISENAFFYFNTNKDNYCQVYAGFEDLKPLDSYYGDYAKLTDEQKNELIAQNASGDDGSTDVRFEKVNGRTYLLIAKSEEDTGTGNKYRVYAMYTVIGSYKYIVQIVAVNPDKNDLQVVNEMLNSIKLGGIKEPSLFRGERLEPRALHEDAPLDESVFRENLLQFGALVCVPPVDRADGHKVVEVHSPTIIPKSAPLRGPADTVFGAGEAGRGYSYLSAMMGSSLEARIAG